MTTTFRIVEYGHVRVVYDFPSANFETWELQLHEHPQSVTIELSRQNPSNSTILYGAASRRRAFELLRQGVRRDFSTLRSEEDLNKACRLLSQSLRSDRD